MPELDSLLQSPHVLSLAVRNGLVILSGVCLCRGTWEKAGTQMHLYLMIE